MVGEADFALFALPTAAAAPLAAKPLGGAVGMNVADSGFPVVPAVKGGGTTALVGVNVGAGATAPDGCGDDDDEENGVGPE